MTLAELLALVEKKEAKVAAINKRRNDALAASEAEGVSDEDKAKHVALFDAADAELPAAEKELARAVAARDAVQRQQAHDRSERTQAAAGTPHLGTRLASPHAGPNDRRSRRERNLARHTGQLKAFKGPNAKENAYEAGLWVAATMFNHAGCRAEYEEKYGAIEAAISTTNNAGAAYFVPEVLETTIIELVQSFGVFRQYAELVNMTSDSQTEPRWTGGLTAYFVAEGKAPTESNPAWDKVGLTAKNLACFGKMSRNFSEDSIIDMGDKWAMAAAVAFAEKEDDCGFNGDGTSPYGLMTGLRVKLGQAANAASLYTATGRTTPGALLVADFANVVGKLPEYPGIRPAWFCHKEVYGASMEVLKRTAGGVSMAEMAQGGRPEYAGYPVVFSQKMPKLAAATTGTIPILFGDLAMSSKFGERRGRTFEIGLDGNDFSQQMISLLSTQRFDINNHTVTDPRNAAEAGPVVGLKLG